MTRLILCMLAATSLATAAEKPNIVVILADDLGYGDVRCLNPEGKIATPNMDRVARAGMIFTDAHSSSSVCSPTRYSLLTGRYNWRSKLKSGVLGGLSPRLIEPNRMTVASLLKQHGYHTACFGKWHLGMDWVRQPGKEVTELNIEPREQVWNVDFSKPIGNGPTSVGFDEYFGISASLDMVPYTFIQDDAVEALPTKDLDFPLMLGRTTGRTRRGPAVEGFDAADVLPELRQRAVDYIGRRANESRQGHPFFLYLPLASPHTPIVPTSSWQNKSGLNPYADFVMETDAAIGAVLDALDKHNLTQNTLLILTSDNGCSPQAKFDELLAQGHNPNYRFRGNKADIYEGGHRVPFLVRWPNHVAAGKASQQLICLMDLLATCAAIVDAEKKLLDNVGEDSISFLPALLDKTDSPRRQALVHHSINGSFAIRQGNWKLCFCPDSGGWSNPRPGQAAKGAPPVQLFDLAADIAEKNNLADKHPDVVEQLTKLMEKYITDGRSTPGTPQPNNGPVTFRKP